MPWRWVAALLGLSLAQALLQYLALRRGFAAGGSLAAGLVRSLVRACRAGAAGAARSRRPKACCAVR
ncbi:hypothetical protein [Pseudomonas aeruginosa]|uniref:hypothetical protein n=1 Tax=Pseudomonas aeruginosa TaxID=287 RepID=UPI0032B00603